MVKLRKILHSVWTDIKSLDSWKMRHLILIIGILFLFSFSLLVNVYYSINSKFFRAIADQPNSKELAARLGTPEEILKHNDTLIDRGWKLPRFIPKQTSTIWIYSVFTGTRFYLFFDENGQMIGHFSSSS